MGRARKRARLARAAGQVPAPARGPGPAPPGGGRDRGGRPSSTATPPNPRPAARQGHGPAAGQRPLDDPQWRRAERRRVLLLSLLPGPPQQLARRGRAGLAAVLVLQMALVVALGLLLARVATGDWLPPFVAVLVLGVAVTVQYASRAVNSRVPP